MPRLYYFLRRSPGNTILALISSISILLSSSDAAAEGTLETIFFVSDDLKTGLMYKNTRYDSYGRKAYFMGENYDQNNITYVKPDDYQWEKLMSDGVLNDCLTFDSTNNYAFLERIDLASKVGLHKVEEADNHYDMLIDGGACMNAGCRVDEVIISVVLPKKFKVIDYAAFEINDNDSALIQDPDFRLIENTLTLYSNNVQGAYMLLRIQDISSSSVIYRNVESSMKQYSEISVTRTGAETRITMPMDNVFASGKASMNPQGRLWLKTLTTAIADSNFQEIRVEGHTDDTPVKGRYPSNWELSSARAADAVRVLLEQGLDRSRVAVVGYADTRPLVDNSTKANKARNRRIEITIVGKQEPKSADNTPADKVTPPDVSPADESDPTTGQLSRAQVVSTLQPAADTIRKCGTGSLGILQLRIQIAPDGSVVSAEAIGEFASTTAGSCAAKLVQMLQFPTSSRSLTITYPFKI